MGKFVYDFLTHKELASLVMISQLIRWWASLSMIFQTAGVIGKLVNDLLTQLVDEFLSCIGDG